MIKKILQICKPISKFIGFRDKSVFLSTGDKTGLFFNNLENINLNNHFLINAKYLNDIIIHLKNDIEVYEDENKKMCIRSGTEDFVLDANIVDVLAHPDMDDKITTYDFSYIKAFYKKTNPEDIYFNAKEKSFFKLNKTMMYSAGCSNIKANTNFVLPSNLIKIFDKLGVNEIEIWSTNNGLLFADSKFNFTYYIEEKSKEYFLQKTYNEHFEKLLEKKFERSFNVHTNILKKYSNINPLVILNKNNKTLYTNIFQVVLEEKPSKNDDEFIMVLDPKETLKNFNEFKTHTIHYTKNKYSVDTIKFKFINSILMKSITKLAEDIAENFRSKI